MHTARTVVAAVLVLAAATRARADTIDVNSTTLLRVEQQTRGGATPLSPELVTVAPVFEILSIAARDVTNPLSDDLSVVLTTWGSYSIADHRRWDAGPNPDLNGDVMVGYLSAKFLDRRLTLRLGREMIEAGVARMIQLDGGEAVATLPFGLRISAYAGSPVSQRFAARDTIVSWNPAGGDLAYGGRVGWSLGLPGTPGRGLDVGVSTNVVRDGGDPVREEVGADLRLRPVVGLSFTGFTAYSLYAERFAEASVHGDWSPLPRLLVSADWRFTAPDLLLARNSILSVFAAEQWNEVGAGVNYRLRHGIDVGATYHLIIEPGETEESSSHLGHEAEVAADWERGPWRAGGEVGYVDALENGYVSLRVFGRRDLGRFFAALDVIGQVFRDKVNGEDGAVTGTLTAGVDLVKGFSAVVAGRAGMTPFLEQSFDVMAKLVYNSTYRIREVR